MGRIYEALEWHRKESRQKQPSQASRVFTLAKFKPHKLHVTPETVQHFNDLKTSFLSRYGDGSIKTIMVAGIEANDGASTSAVNFAGLLSRASRHRVLLVDGNLRKPSFNHFFNIDNCYSLMNLASGNRASVNQFLPPKIESGNLYVIPSSPKPLADAAGFIQSPNFKQFVDDMRQRFDFTIIDAPPLRANADGIYLSGLVDGVLLVVNAGKTPRWVVQNVQKQIADAGGKIIGVVLNKRRYHVPRWLYNLF